MSLSSIHPPPSFEISQEPKRHKQQEPLQKAILNFPFSEHDHVTINKKKYSIIKILGRGGNGVVYEAFSYEAQVNVAIKVNHIGVRIKNSTEFKNISYVSSKFLKYERRCLKSLGKKSIQNIVTFLDSGSLETEFILNAGKNAETIRMRFLVFEHLSLHVDAIYIKTLLDVKTIAITLLTTLSGMHALDITHCDIKPANILHTHDKRSIKIIDFADALPKISSVGVCKHLQTRAYRAPEVFLRAKLLTTAIDIFSLGCTLAEIAIKRPLFPGKKFIEQAAYFEQALGKIPRKMLENSSKTEKAYTKDFELLHKTPLIDPLAKVISDLLPHEDRNLRYHFIDLLKKMLSLDPVTRITAKEALDHPFLKTYFFNL